MGPLRRAWFSRPSYRARKRRLEVLLATIVRERKAEWSGNDLLSEILRAWPNGAAMPSVEELVSDMVLLLQAGSESTAHQILWGLLLLDHDRAWKEEVYRDPMQFSPSRFLGLDEWPRAAHAVFGGSSHICLGQPLARIEEPLALAIVTAGFDLEPQRPIGLEARLTGVVSPVERHIPVRVRRRR